MWGPCWSTGKHSSKMSDGLVTRKPSTPAQGGMGGLFPSQPHHDKCGMGGLFPSQPHHEPFRYPFKMHPYRARRQLLVTVTHYSRCATGINVSSCTLAAAVCTRTLTLPSPTLVIVHPPLTLLHQSVAAVAHAQHWHLVVHARGLDLGGTAAHIADIAPQTGSICMSQASRSGIDLGGAAAHVAAPQMGSICMQEVVGFPDCAGNAAGCGVSVDGPPPHTFASKMCHRPLRLDSLHDGTSLMITAG